MEAQASVPAFEGLVAITSRAAGCQPHADGLRKPALDPGASHLTDLITCAIGLRWSVDALVLRSRTAPWCEVAQEPHTGHVSDELQKYASRPM